MMAVTRTSLITILTLFTLLNENFSVAENNPSWFNGYYIFPTNGSTAVESITCHDSRTAWITSGTYANCCPNTLTSRCPMPTKCEGTSVHFDNGGGYPCPAGQSCATMTIYETSPGGSPSATNIFCWRGWEADTVYRQLPAEATDSPTITSPPQTSRPPNLPSTAPQEPEPSPPVLPPPAEEEPESNRGVIAGATVGAVVGVSILALAYFFYRRKQKKKGEKAGSNMAELDDSQARAELQRLNGAGGGAGEPKGQGYYGYAAGTIPVGGSPNTNFVHELPGTVKDLSGDVGDAYGGGPLTESDASRTDNATHEMPTNRS